MLQAVQLKARMYSFVEPHSAERRDEIVLELTPEQEELLKAMPERYLDSIGFFHPDQVVSYFCEKCDKQYAEKPGMEVYIIDRKIFGDKIRPEYVCRCGHCDNAIYLGMSHSGAEQIPVKFIVEDQTGDYKKPTPKSIEDRLNQAEAQAREGNFRFEKDIAICRHLAGKISYKLDEERINGFGPIAEEADKKKFENYLPSLVDDILKQSYGFNLTRRDGASAYEGTGLCENVEHLFKNLGRVNLPEDVKVKKKILAILFMYRAMWDNYAADAGRKKRKIKKKMNKRISSCQNASAETSRRISDYCQRADISKVSLDEIADKSGIPHPCDSEEDVDKLFPF